MYTQKRYQQILFEQGLPFVGRAGKKLTEIIKISREIVKKPHKIIILKGRNADKEIKELSIEGNYSYRLEKSITDHDSKIILIEVE